MGLSGAGRAAVRQRCSDTWVGFVDEQLIVLTSPKGVQRLDLAACRRRAIHFWAHAYADGVRTGWAWVVFAAFALHNLEEALAAPAYFDRMAGRLPIPWPAADAFQAATAVVTLAGLVLTVVAVRRSRPGLITLLATVMLVNVAVPHVPLALLSDGYAPGLVTAVLLNLPVDLLWLLRYRRVRRDRAVGSVR